MEEFNWQQIAAQAAEGDKDAFEMLYKHTERSVYFTCLKLLGNEHDAKDIMQDTYITAFEKLPELGDYSNIPGWINRIAINRCKMHFRKQKPDYIDDIPEQAKEIIGESEIIPSDYVFDAEKRHIIMNIIDTQLSDVQRQTVILYYYDEMSVAQIAEIMECPEGTVKYRLSAAREKIGEAVLIYEKENDDKLHAIIPIPVLTSVLRKEAEEIAVPKIQLFKPKISSPKQGTGNNSKLHMKGQNAMTSAIKGKIIAGAAAVIVGGGAAAAVVINNSKADSIQTDSVISSEAESSAAETSASATENSTTDGSSEAEVIKTEIDESDLYNWHIRYYRPSDFTPFPGSGEIFHKKTEKGNEICMVRDTVDIFYLQRHEVENFELEDVPEIMDPLIIENLQRFSSRFYYEIASRSEFDVETEEEREVIGTTFLRKTGVIHAMANGNYSGDYYYITYYGIIDKSIDTGHYNAPICWTMVTDDKTQIPEIERIADTIAEYAEPVE